MRLAEGLLLAFVSTLTLNWGLFAEHRASSALPRLSLRRPLHSLRLLFTNGPWLFGYAVGMAGWGLYIAALFFAPLSLVQAVSAGGVGVLALLVWRSGRHRLSHRDGIAVCLCLCGLVMLCASFGAGIPVPPAPRAAGVLTWVAVTVGSAAVCLLFGRRLLRPGAALGAAAGLLYAAGDVSTKGAVNTSLLFVPLLVACHVLGFIVLQLAFQRGTALATAGMATLLNNSIPIMAGIVVFHEQLPAGLPGVVRAVSFVLVVAGAALLARPETDSSAVASEASAPPRAASRD